MFPLNSENFNLFTININNVSQALEQIFFFFQMKKEETKNSTSSNYSNYSVMEGNGNGFNLNKKFLMPEKLSNGNKNFVTNSNSYYYKNINNIIDTNTNFEDYDNFHEGQFFMMDSLR